MPDRYAVDYIDRALDAVRPRCAQCRHPLGNSPSDDFCGYNCQQAWHHQRAAAGPMPSKGLRFDRGGSSEDRRRARDDAIARVNAKYQRPAVEAYPPGLFESLKILIRQAWRKR